MGNHDLASLVSLSYFSQGSNAYSSSLNTNMTLKLHIMTHFGTVFNLLLFNSFLSYRQFTLLKLQDGNLRIWCIYYRHTTQVGIVRFR